MTQWRKSSYSGTSNNSDCVELAALPQGVGARDSKAPHHGHLIMKPQAFTHLVNQIKAGQLDH